MLHVPSKVMAKLKYVGVAMIKLKKTVSITLDSDLIEQVRVLSERADRSLSQYINLVLRRHLEARERAKKAQPPV